MIVQVNGNVKFPITLDPSVWIFDDRKVLLEEYLQNGLIIENNDEKTGHSTSNKGLTKQEREKVLENSYVMPIKQFLLNAEPLEKAQSATLHTDQGEVQISYEELLNSVLLFALNGKPLKEDGPVHVYTNHQSEPIKGVNKITLN